MSYGTPLNITLPTIDGVFTEAQAAPLINASFNAIKARLEQKVGVASMDINGDLSYKSGASYFGAKDLHRASFTSLGAALSAGSYPTSCYSFNGNLYYNDSSGNQVQITSGGQVNVSTTGGITGAGYGAGGVEVNWDSGNSRYRMRSGTAADDFAAVMADDILLVDDSGNAIRLGSPSAISADYTCLLPTAVPGSTSLLRMTSGGQMETTRDPSIDTLAVGSTSAFTGKATFGAIAHNTRTKVLSVASFTVPSEDAWTYVTAGGGAGGYIERVTSVVGTSVVLVDLGLMVDDRLTGAITVRCYRKTTQAVTARLIKETGETTTEIVSATTDTAADGWVILSLAFAPETLSSSSTQYYVRIESGSGGATRISRVALTFDRP